MQPNRQRLLFSLVLLISPVALLAQDIQWASSIDFVFNEDNEVVLEATAILGPPDASPYGKLNENAISLSSEAAFGTIVVNYEKPQSVNKVIVVENYLPGKVVNVILFDENGTRYHVYDNHSNALPQDSRCLIINIPENDYKVSRVELNINTRLHKGWSQIDAIGITSNKNLEKLKEALTPYGIDHIQEELSYSDTRINLGKGINSLYDETKPIISADGKTLYFCRQNFPGNFGGTNDSGDIYSAQFVDGRWKKAKSFQPPLNNEYTNGINSVSPDGKSLLLMNQVFDGNTIEQGVSLSYLSEKGWSIPEKLVIKDFYNLSEYGDFFLSTSGKALLMAIEREDSEGDQDLYVSLDHWGNAWSEPINLGPKINSDQAEFAPYLSDDGKRLYFASEGHGGFGGSDIFYSDRLDDTWKNWSTPKNMGSLINSPYWDAYYSTTSAADFAFFASKKGSYGASKDIFKIELPREVKTNPVVTIVGQVVNKNTYEPLRGAIEIRSVVDGKVIGSTKANHQNGRYHITLPSGQDYELLSSAYGFHTFQTHVKIIASNFNQHVEKNIELEPFTVGETIILNDLNFVQSKAEMLDNAFHELNRLLLLLKENPDLIIELGGHTDGVGDADLNMKLSEDRVIVVKEFLVNSGIEDRRIELKAYGSSKPIASNNLEATRKLNRRVEITILSN